MQKMNKLVQVLLLAVLSHNVCAAGDAKHFPGIFLGVTHAESEFTDGFEYEYKFTSNGGVSAVYEKTDDAPHGDGEEAWIVGVAFVRPF